MRNYAVLKEGVYLSKKHNILIIVNSIHFVTVSPRNILTYDMDFIDLDGTYKQGAICFIDRKYEKDLYYIGEF